MIRDGLVILSSVALAACSGGSSSADAPTGDDAGAVAADAGSSRCSVEPARATCEHESVTLAGRQVHFGVPRGQAPSAGWPAVVLFQGSFIPASAAWDSSASASYGLYQQAVTVAALLDAGFAVITPEPRDHGGSLPGTYWDTNIDPWATDWESSPDHQLMVALLAAVDDGTFGTLDGARLYATGLSSGGYMTSRMAVSYPGRFRALAIHSASYATCLASACAVPALPVDHPPTLFVHGAADSVVPPATMESYREALIAQGTDSEALVVDGAGHAWLAEAADQIVSWLTAYP